MRHLLAEEVPSYDALLRIADAWGLPMRAAQAAARGALTAGSVRCDRYVLMLERFRADVLRGVAERVRATEWH